MSSFVLPLIQVGVTAVPSISGSHFAMTVEMFYLFLYFFRMRVLLIGGVLFPHYFYIVDFDNFEFMLYSL